MAFRLLAQPIKRAVPLASRAASTSLPKTAGTVELTENSIYGDKIGSREIVGFGYNGLPAYADRVDFPLPAIRWREDTQEIKLLREKEKGDWKKLTKQEKKALYRASFCQTFQEFKAPTGEWKICVAATLLASGLALWFAVWMRVYVYDPLPDSFTEENLKLQLKKMLELEVNAVDGISSKWDYENKRWK